MNIGPGIKLIGRTRNRVGLFTLLAILSVLLLPYIGTNAVYSASPPVAADLSPVAEDAKAVTIYLSGSDLDGDALTFIITSLPSGALDDGGAINSVPTTLSGNTVTFTGAGIGSDSFDYKVNDGALDSVSDATVTVDVIQANLDPVSLDFTVTNATSTLTIFLGGSDAEATTLDFYIESPIPSGGVLFDNGTQIYATSTFPYLLTGGSEVTYQANSSPLNESFSYTSSDASGNISSTATVTVDTDAGNSGSPVAFDLDVAADVNTEIPISLPGFDPDGDLATFTLLSGPSSGKLKEGGSNINSYPHSLTSGDNLITYDPIPTTSGIITFDYEIDAGGGSSNTATVTIALGHAPDADDLSPTINEDTVLDVLLSGSHSTNAALSFIVTSLPSDGILEDAGTSGLITLGLMPYTLSSGGNVATYAPNTDYNGPDSFAYIVRSGGLDSPSATVSLTVAVVNDPPVADDDGYIVDEDTTLNVNAASGVLNGDTDVESVSLIAVKDTNPGNGTVTLNSDGSFTYNANADFCGADSFTYHANDTQDDSNIATVSIDVTCINDAPSFILNAPTAVAEDSPQQTPTVATGFSAGPSNESGQAIQAYIVSNVVNGGILSSGPTVNNSGVLSYTPAANAFGTVTFDLQVQDDGGVANSGVDTSTPAQSVSIVINAANDAPVATDNSYIVDEDNQLTGNVITDDTGAGADSDVDGDTPSINNSTSPSNGVLLSLSSNGSFTYVPDPNYCGPDSFTYVVNDSPPATLPALVSGTATVSIAVNCVNDDPVALNDAANIAHGALENIDVLFNDSDTEGDPLAITFPTPPSNGTAVVNNNGTPSLLTDDTVDYTHDGSSATSDSFVYQVDDGNGGFDTATVTIKVLVVNAVDDPTPGVCDFTHCSLREAILLANTDPNFNTIAFGIDVLKANGNGDFVIKPGSALPAITATDLVIDGTTQTGHAAKGGPVIVIYGQSSIPYGLQLQGSGITVKGLVINRFGRDAIRITGAGGHTIQGSYLGTDGPGNLDRGNGLNGVFIINSPDNVIGGTASGEGNVISGNNSVGVRIEGAASTGNRVEANLIGTDATGTAKVGNGYYGVALMGAPSNFIGNASSTPNVISGNGYDGIVIDWNGADLNEIQGNYIGLDVNGSAGLGNGHNGINIQNGTGNVILGGDIPSERNVISGNGRSGVRIYGPSGGNTVSGNIIGLDVSGTQPIGNGYAGIWLENSSNNTIGGVLPSQRNIISDSRYWGILVYRDSNDNDLQGNYIGTDITGSADRGNGSHGIWMYYGPDGNSVGSNGVTPGKCDGGCNIIAFSGGNGVLVQTLNPVRNAVLGNSIFANSRIGIDLSANGVSPNDLATANKKADDDEGANRGQNFPKIALVRLDANDDLAIRYDVPSDPTNSTYPLLVQFFKVGVGGQPMEFLGSDTYETTDFDAGFKDELLILTGVTVANDDQIVATATDGNGTENTSEFSEVAVVGVTPPHVVNSTADLGDSDTTDSVCDTGGASIGGQSPCTFRAALEQAESVLGPDSIIFDIPVPVDPDADPTYSAITGVFTIKPATPFTLITDELIIDGTTQTGYAATPLIEINGANAGNQTIGLHISGGDNTVRGLAINGFDGDGIRIQTDGGNLIEANFIGTDATGLTTDPDATPDSGDETGNGGDGIRISRSPNNTILDNVISGNSSNGVTIFGVESSGNVLQDNRIGADVNGFEGLPNSGDGVFVLDASDNSLSGGNVIAFNLGSGVAVDAGSGIALDGNEIFGNGSLGIDLGNDGATSNDPADADINVGNNLQNSPVINRVRVQVDLIVDIEFSVDSDPVHSAYPLLVEFFRADSSGQGRVLLGSNTYSATDFNAGGFKTVDLGQALVLNLVKGDQIVGLATDANGNTSEFSVVKSVSDFGQGSIFVVDSAEDGADASAGDGICDNGSGACTLRAAIEESNVNSLAIPRLDRIDFAIGAGPATITLTSQLPTITDALIIDGTSQPGFATTPIITLDGTGAGSNADGLTITGGDSLVRGLVINNFRSDGIVLKTAGDNIIVGNFLGTDVTGLAEAPNFHVGLRIDNSPNNLIGGSTEADRNVISGNQQRGVLIENSNSSGNQISGNFIGVGADGLTIVDNGLNGIRIADAPSNVIGGTDAGEGNVISGNGEHGVLILNSGSNGNLVQGNYIGTDLTGLVDLGNLGSGVRIENADNNVVGGFEGNAANNIDAGDCTGACNTIAFNGDDGIYLLSGLGNSFLSNSLYQNVGIGIDLGGPGDVSPGVTSNDFGDFDSGPNDLQNSPVFAAIAPARIDASDSLIVEYSVDSPVSVGDPIEVQFFVADVDDQEGATYVGSDTYTSSGIKTATILDASAMGVVDGDVLLATATDASGSTSEYTEVAVTVVEATFFVNTNVDAVDIVPGDGICSAGVSVGCTLRAAIMEANAVAGQDAIHFNLPTTSPSSPLLTLTLDGVEGPLPAVTDSIVIDGTTQLGFTSAPIIILDGTAISGPALEIGAGNSIIRGLEITFFGGHGILINTGTDSLGGSFIEGNLIRQNAGSGVFIDNVAGNIIGGTTAAVSNTIRVNSGGDGVTISGASASGNKILGNSLLSNTFSGVAIVDAPSNTIGGTEAGAANIINGNVLNGITISGGAADGNVIEGNFIGTDDADVTSPGNLTNGVVISGAPSNTVGGTTAEAANVISGNVGNGVVLESGATGNFVLGNAIGTTADGLASLANSGIGVLIDDASANTIGGTASGAGNLISGNSLDGVQIQGSASSANLVLGNLIGTDSTGTLALGNGGDGVEISDGSNNIIGGTLTEAANVIAANGDDGVLITGLNAKGNLIQGNFIGTDLASTVALGNALAGVHVASGADDNVIGGVTGVSVGTCSGVCNVIANNGGDGVYVQSGTGNAIQGNSMFANGAGASDLAIDLGTDGRTINDGGDVDGGANNLQNFPVISSALINAHGNLVLRYSLDSPPTSQVEFYEADASGLQGETLLGTDDYTSSSSATEVVSLGTSTGIVSGDKLVATATSSGNTSEFSDAVTVADAKTFVVNVNTDGLDTTPCINGTSGCTLRSAIDASNSSAGADTITFSGSLAIALGSQLPTSTDPVIIDASSATVTIDGSGLAAGDGLVIAGGDSVVRGLRIVNFPGNGIVILGNGSGVVIGNADGGTLVEDNQIGTNGTLDQGNALDGVLITNSVNNVIGGITSGQGNLISGNDGQGVRVDGAGSTGNKIQGNLIGTNAGGTSGIANGGAGVLVSGGADDSLIGDSDSVTAGSCDGACNTIAFNGGNGVEIQSGTSNTVSANATFSNAALGIQAGTSNVPDLKGARKDLNQELFVTFGIQSPQVLDFPLTVEFFLADVDDEEGKTYLGSATYNDGTFNNSTANLGAVGVAVDDVIVASATAKNGGATTNFSPGVIVTVAAIFTVDSNLDTSDAIPSDGLCDDGSGKCTLRAALEEANSVAGVDEIHFNLLPAELTILPDSALPDLDDPARIDGTTQTGYVGTPLVRLDGSNLGTVNGLNLTADGSTVKGMAVTNFGGSGIYIDSSDSVIGGSTGDGNEIYGNTGDGVRIVSGIDNAVRANSIYDNTGLGINLIGLLDQPNGVTDNDVDDDDDVTLGPNHLQNFPDISDVRIDAVGNLIVEYSIPSLPANSDFPITAEFFTADAAGQEGKTYLGSDSYTDLAQSTQIANLGQVGVADGQLVLATATDVNGETSEFGLTVAAVQVPAFVVDSIADSDDINSADGVCDVGDGTCTLRAAISQSNVIAGVDGIQFSIAGAGPHIITLSTQLPQVTGSLVIDGYSEPDYSGTPVIEIDGTSVIPVGLDIVSGDSVVRGLTLRGFTSHAIVLDTGGDNTLQGNVIGTSVQGNGGNGVFITGSSSDNTVGGTGAGEGNSFVNNQGDGVNVESGVNNAVLGNGFESSGGLAVDLGNDGATANDVDLAVPANEDIDTGANNLQNFPTLTSAQFVSAALEMTYSVSSHTANSTYPLHIEFYAQEQTGALVYLGSDTYDVADAQAAKTVNLGVVAINATDSIVSTATDMDGQGGTSEFSVAIASPPQVDLAITVTSSVDSVTAGSRVTFTVDVTNNGPSDASSVVVSNALVSGLTFVTTSPTPPVVGTYDNLADIWSIGTLANGATASLGFVFDSVSPRVVISQPTVASNAFDSNGSNNDGNKAVTVTAVVVSTPAPSAGSSSGGLSPSIPKAIGHTHEGRTLNFTAQEGEGNPSPQTVGVFNPGRGTLEWSFISDVAWLTMTPRSGSSRNDTPTDVEVVIDATGLAVGEYAGIISIVAGEVDNSPQTIEVVLIVVPPPPEDQRIAFSPDLLSFTAVEGDPNPVLESFEVWNAGDLTLDWSVEADVEWLTFLPGGGTSQGERALVTATADATGFTAGTYTANVTINAEVAVNAPQTLPVELVVLAPAPVIDTDQSAYTIVAPESGPNPGRQVIQVINDGGRDMEWSATVDQSWLSLDVDSGISSPDQPAELGLLADVTGLTLGTYDATLEITSADAVNSPYTVTITLVVDLPNDADEDGVPDIIENDGPNGGDANNDGVPDSQQQNVSSVPDANSRTFVTLESSAGTLLAGVQTLENPSPGDAPSRVAFPLGFVEYNVSGIAPGDSAEVILTLDDDAGIDTNKFYKYGPTPTDAAPHWYEFTYDGETGVELQGNRIVMHLVDGQRGDDDLKDNGLIVTVGAPADDRRVDLVMTGDGIRDLGTLSQPLRYTVTVLNEGPAMAMNVIVSQPLPSGFDLVTATPSKGACNPGDGVQCNLRSLQIGESVSVEFIVRTTVVIEEPFPYETRVSSDNLDISEDNNVVSVDMTVADPTLALADSRVNITAIEGNPRPLPYALGVRNSGSSGQLRWSISSSCSSAEVSAFPVWMRMTPVPGVTVRGDGSALIGVDISSLSPGSYTAAFAVSDIGAGLGCQDVEVVLSVLPAIGRPEQDSVNLQEWELQSIGGIVQEFFATQRDTIQADQQPWFVAAAALAGRLESDETIRRSVPLPSSELGTSLKSLSRLSESLGNWSGQGAIADLEQFATVEQSTNDLTGEIGAILAGQAQWDPNQIGIIQISATADEKLFVFYNRPKQELLVHFDTFDGVAGQIDGVIPVAIEAVEGVGDQLLAGDAPSVYSRQSSVLSAAIGSPGEIRVSDEIGRVTGMVNGTITINIPNSTFFADKVFVMLPTDAQALAYFYDIVGNDDGQYSIDVNLRDSAGVDTLFHQGGVEIGPNEIHTYSVDWPNLEEGQGWQRRVFVEQDGNYELVDVFPPVLVERRIVPEWVWPELVIGLVVVMVLALLILWVVVSWSEPIRDRLSNGLTPVRKVMARFGMSLRLPRLPEPSWSRYIRF